MSRNFEINKSVAKAGRVPFKQVLHKIYPGENSYNINGISWSRKYTKQNIDSVKGMPFVCQFLDKDNQIPFGSHGDAIIKDGEVTFEDSLVVGTFEDAYIDDNLELNGEKYSGLVGQGYIYSQRFPALVDYLQEQYDSNNIIDGSVEICADKGKGNNEIVYEKGYKEKGRVPKEYQYSGDALCIGVPPADNSAVMLELNKAMKQKGDNLTKTKKYELNELAYDDIATLVMRAFIRTISTNLSNNSYNYEIYKLYPISGRVIFRNCSVTPLEYYMTSYMVTNTTVTIGEIERVEEDWKPFNDEKAVEINATHIKNILNLKDNKEDNSMDENTLKSFVSDIKNTVTEINSKNTEYETKVKKLTEDNKNLSETNTKKDSQIAEKDKKITELNESINQLTVELNKLKKTSKVNELNKALEDFTDEQKAFAKEEIDKFNADPMSVEINTITDKILIGIGKSAKIAETNSKKQEVDTNDIFADVYEINSKHDEEISIF